MTAGRLAHDYTAQQSHTGLKLHRKHYSTDHAFRTHEKVNVCSGEVHVGVLLYRTIKDIQCHHLRTHVLFIAVMCRDKSLLQIYV